MFATQFCFNTDSKADMEVIRAIDEGYAWTAEELESYEFIDLTFRVGNRGLFPIFRADMVKLTEREVRYDEPAEVTPL